MLAPWKKSCSNPRQHTRKQRHHFAGKGSYSQSYGFPKVMYRYKNWTIKKAECRRIDAFELWCQRTLESSLGSKEIKLDNPKGSQSWIFIGKTDAWSWSSNTLATWCKEFGKDPDAGKDWGQEGKGATEDEMVEWHHWFSGHVFEQTPEDSEGQESLACCSSWGCKKLEVT